MNLAPYRALLRERRTRRLLVGLGVSALGDGMSTVTIAWLAVRLAPAGELGVFVGLAVASYTLPGVIGALAFGRLLRARPARALVLVHCLLRAGFLGAVAALWRTGALAPAAYVALLAGSSLLWAWGNAGQYTMLSELGGPEGRLAINSLATAQVSFAVIVGPLVAGILIGWIGPGWLIALDAASFAFLGVQAWRTPTGEAATEQPVDPAAAESGFRLLARRRDLLGLTALTWVFFFLYGPVEAALPVYVAHDLGADGALLGAYWMAFGIGALAATLVTGTLRSGDIRRATLLIVAGWGVPAPVRLRSGRRHARLLRGRRAHLRAVHPAHVRPVPVSDPAGQPALGAGRPKRDRPALDPARHRHRWSARRQARRVGNARGLRGADRVARRRRPVPMGEDVGPSVRRAGAVESMGRR